MNNTRNKIGFKFTWETQETDVIDAPMDVVNTQAQNNTPTAFRELADRIDTLKDVMVSTAYAKMKKAQRINIVEQYDFYLSLFNEFTLTR